MKTISISAAIGLALLVGACAENRRAPPGASTPPSREKAVVLPISPAEAVPYRVRDDAAPDATVDRRRTDDVPVVTPSRAKPARRVAPSPARPATRRSVAVQCSGTTRAGNRCRRRTKNSSGRCHQH